MKSVCGGHSKSGWTSLAFTHLSPPQTKLRMTLETTIIFYSVEKISNTMTYTI
jgi:hypothetical protein